MPYFRVLINAKNVFSELETKGKHCFFTTVFVEAKNDSDAEKNAATIVLDQLKRENILLNESNDPPILITEEIEQLENISQDKQGRVWYLE